MQSNGKEGIPQIREQLARAGLPAPTLEGIGTFLVVWGLFETALETAVWAIRDERVKGVRPSTDGPPASEWLKALEKGHPSFSTEANDVLKAGKQAAADLMEYRHCLLHGAMIPFPGGPVMIRNIGRRGEVRKRPRSDAYMRPHLLDSATLSAWTLWRLALATEKCLIAGRDSLLVAMLRPEVARAAAHAKKLRLLTTHATGEDDPPTGPVIRRPPPTP